MNLTLNEFIEDMEWSTLEFTYEELTDIYSSVNTDSFQDITELEQDLDLNPENDSYSWDMDLSSVLEFFGELNTGKIMQFVHLYYLPGSEVFAGVLSYEG